MSFTFDHAYIQTCITCEKQYDLRYAPDQGCTSCDSYICKNCLMIIENEYNAIICTVNCITCAKCDAIYKLSDNRQFDCGEEENEDYCEACR